jgi:hypothetical protein
MFRSLNKFSLSDLETELENIYRRSVSVPSIDYLDMIELCKESRQYIGREYKIWNMFVFSVHFDELECCYYKSQREAHNSLYMINPVRYVSLYQSTESHYEL